MTKITVNGNDYSDDGTAAHDMNNGGHRQYLMPMLSDAIIDLQAKKSAAQAAQGAAEDAQGAAEDAAGAAQGYAATAAASPNTRATSTTNDAIALGPTTITIEPGKALSVGQSVKMAMTVAPTNWMFGDITAYDSGTGSLTINVTAISGNGNSSAWTVSVAGPQGVSGTNGYTGRLARAADATLGAADIGKIVDVTGGTFTQTFAACATLGGNWHCWIKNSGNGDVTLDPNGAETIDGLSSFIMYPGEVRLITCDGAALRSIVIQGYYKVFTSSATFIKPPGYKSHDGVLWSGGQGGNFGGGPGASVTGGFGGGAFPFSFPDSLIPANVSVTIGAGGAGVTTGSGLAGGDSSFGTLLTVKGATSAQGGAVARPDGTAFVVISNSALGVFGFEGAAMTSNCNNTVWGGAGAIGTPAISGSSIWGGAAGASMNNNAATTAGTSKFGGNGGATGQPGAAPAGGGGSAAAGTTGAGARGELRIQGVV